MREKYLYNDHDFSAIDYLTFMPIIISFNFRMRDWAFSVKY
jgi:hypothetical protein